MLRNARVGTFLESPQRQRVLRWILWAVIVAETTIVFWAMEKMGGDSEVYLNLAEGLKTGSFGFFKDGQFYQEPIRGPGYPLFLWFSRSILHLPLSGIVAIQWALYLVSILLLDRWIIKSYRRVHGLVFLGLLILYPFSAVYAVRIQTEALATLLITSISVVAAQPASLTVRRALLLGLLAGLVILVRPTMILLPIVVAAGHLFLYRSKRRHMAHPRTVLVMLLSITALIVLPFAVRNERVFGRFTPLPVAGAAGISLYTASWGGALRYEDILSMWEQRPSTHVQQIGYLKATQEINAQINAPPTALLFSLESYGPDPLMQIRASGVIGQAAITRIRSHPGPYLGHVVQNIWSLWNTKEYPQTIPPIGIAMLTVISGILTVLGGAGVVIQVVRHRWGATMIPSLIMLYFVAIHLWLHTEARYTAPARLLLVFHAMVAVMWLINRWRQPGYEAEISS
jgi:hypothetical protein